MKSSFRTRPALALAVALAAVLAGCSGKSPDAAAPATPPAAAKPVADEPLDVTRGEEVKLPPTGPQSSAEQAQSLLRFIEDKPECQPFRAQLEQAAAGQAVAPDMGKLMDEVYRAGCQKAAAGG